MKNKWFSCIALSAFILALPFFTLAATFESGEFVSLSNPINDDLYAAGGKLIISEPVDNDALVAAGELTVNSSVGQDAILVGGNVFLNGSVGDDARLIGGDIHLFNPVVDDVVLVGGNITLGKDATVGGDLTIAGGAIAVESSVAGSTRIRGGEVFLNGVYKDLNIQADTITIRGQVQGESKLAAERIVLEEGAEFLGSVEYWEGAQRVDFAPHLAEGIEATLNSDLKLPYETQDISFDFAAALKGIIAGFLVLSVLSAALILLIVISFTRNFFADASKKLLKSFWSSFGWGILYFILLPILSILFFITVIGWPIGLILLFVWLISMYLAKIFAALVLAHAYTIHYKKKWGKVAIFFTALLIFLILKIIVLIPIIGWIISAIIALGGFGAFLMQKKEVWKKIS